MNENQRPFLARLRELQVGESIEQPISKRSYLSVAATRFGVEWNKKFKIHSDRDKRIVTITRVA